MFVRHARVVWTMALTVLIVSMLAIAVVPGEQRVTAAQERPALSPLDYIQIQQLVRKYAWALDSGDNYGYGYADLFMPDGEFVGTNQGPSGRTYRGRDELAALARGGTRSPTQQSHFTMNHVIAPGADGVATGRVYVAILDIGVVGRPNRVNHGGMYEDVYQKTAFGWRFKKRTYYESKVDVWPSSAPRPTYQQ